MALAVRRIPGAFSWRLVRQASRRLSWGVADQAMSSVSNFAVNIYIARTLGAVQYGAFALAYVTYGFALNASRGLATDPLVVRFSGTNPLTWRRAVANCTGTAVVVGLVAGAGVLAAATLLGGAARLAFLALGLTLPALMLQDSWRFSFFALGRGGQAFLNDAIWTVALLPALALLRVAGHANVFWFVFAWGAAAAVAAAVGPLQARAVPKLPGLWKWISQNRDLGPRYLAEGTVNTASIQLRNYGIGLILGLAAVGYVQAAGTLMGPFMVIFFGLGLVLVPEAARVLRRSPRHLALFCALVSAGLVLLALAWGVVLLVALPNGLGHLMLGSLWLPTYPLVLPSTIIIMGACASTGPGVGLHALAAARRSLRAMVITSALTVVFGLVGAAAGGADGALWGTAVVSWIAALLYWWQLRTALREPVRERERHNVRSGRSQSSQPEEGPTEKLSGTRTPAGDNGIPRDGIPPSELTKARRPATGAAVRVPAQDPRPQVGKLDPCALEVSPSAQGTANTREDNAEQDLALTVYSHANSRPDDQLRRYRHAATTDPVLHALVQTCVDWARCGFARPILEPDLLALARGVLAETHPDLRPDNGEMDEALQRACQPVAAGQAALLRRHQLADRTHTYDAFDYVAAADDGQGEDARPVTEMTWRRLLDRATDEDALNVGAAAYLRGNIPVAVAASRRAANGAGLPDAQYALGMALATRLDPPDLAGARTWYTRAAEAGHTRAQYDLGVLLATRLDPPDLAGARTWYTRAAEAGDVDAQYDLGVLLADLLDPPDLAGARTWYTRAAEAGDIDAQYNLGVLLADLLDPPDLAGARTWYTRAAEAGDADAQDALGRLLATRLDPPDLAQART
jgi:O-antigen/teichoic acid export membrane protein